MTARSGAALRGAILAAAWLALPALATPQFVSGTFENDFFAGYDRHFTNGLQLAFLADLDGTPEWLRSTSADSRAVIAIGQRIYTPTDTLAARPEPDDRPYAGWLYVMGEMQVRSRPTIDHLTVTAGIVGPGSLARQSQNNIHRMIGNDEAHGWDTQVRDRPTLMVSYDRAWPAVAQGKLGEHDMDVSLRAGATVGTPFTYATAGTVIRFGRHLPRDIPVTSISVGPPRDGFRGAAQPGWYVWTGFDARAVAYNQFLQGSTFDGAPTVQRKALGGDVQVGVAWVWETARIGFTMVQRSKEFEEQRGHDRFGQLALSYAY